MINNTKIGEVIKFFRIKNDMSQSMLADLVGVSRTEISKIEIGVRKTINKQLLKKICNILSINFDKLIQSFGDSNKGNELKKYKVTIKEIIETDYIVSADNEIAAIDFVENFFKLADNLQCEINKESEVFSEINVEEVRKNTSSPKGNNYILFDEYDSLL